MMYENHYGETMSIIRTPDRRRYTSIANSVAQDANLSFEARGVLLYLLSKPDNWTIRFEDVEREGKIGREKRQRIFSELESNGYFTRESYRTDGKFQYEYQLHETPLNLALANSYDELNIVQPRTGLPSTVEPSTVEPSPVNPPLQNTEETKDGKRKDGGRKSAPALPPANPNLSLSNSGFDARKGEGDSVAVAVLRSVFPNQHLTPFQIDLLESENVDETVFRRTVEEWAAAGYQGRNVGGMIDRYRNNLKAAPKSAEKLPVFDKAYREEQERKRRELWEYNKIHHQPPGVKTNA